MEKHSSQNDEHEQRKQGETPARKHTPGENMEQEMMPCAQLQGLFQSFPDSMVICDPEDKILRFNAATLTLFEILDEAVYRGASFQQFLHTFQQEDDLHLPDSAEYWPSSLNMGPAAAPHPIEKSLLLHLPSGHEVAVHLWYAPLFDEEKHVAGTVAIFTRVTPPYQDDLHLQQVHEAIVALNTVIASLPVYDAQALPEEPLLLSPQVSMVAQPLVDLIDQVLNSRRVLLLAIGSAGQLSYIASSGLTAEQEQILRASKDVVASIFVDEQVLARLSAHQQVLLASQDLRKRPSFASAFGSETLLMLPLFLEEQFVGVLIIFKAGVSAGYTPEETEFAKTLVLEIELLVECLDILHERIESGTRALAQQEVGRLSNDFLALASHDLKTPLTGIMGNIQLAQRRLTRLKQQVRERAGDVSKSLEQLEEPLASAVENARLQQHVIEEMIDTLSIQTRPFEGHMKEENLLKLLQETVTRLRRSAPGRTIVLKIPPGIQAVLIHADGQQIIEVLTNYLVNALGHSSVDRPVTVQLVITDIVALILVHDEGLGLATEEQKALLRRAFESTDHMIQHGVDMNLGTGFYLSRMLIEQYHGHVGVQSHPEHGTTFWLTLPIEGLLAT